jgi:16S rRNA (cytidine1402-2'-O)-methyltransferase
VPIGDEQPLIHIPDHNLGIVRSLERFIAEDAKTARRFLKVFGYQNLERAAISLLNEHSDPRETESLLNDLLQGHDVGLMSDAGCPGIADPGAEVVKLAHRHGIEVVPLAGPSSIVFAIMASGFNGQNFAFVGYLPIDKAAKVKRIKELEQLAGRIKQAQFFIETPYRNQQLFDQLLGALSPGTSLFIGSNIGSQNQLIVSKKVSEWKKAPAPDLQKVPAVWGIYL